MISLVVAASENNAIGKNNKLLWYLPNDMKFFKNTTWGLPVVMGRKTFESIGNKPLKGRKNIVITRQTAWDPGGILIAKDIDAAIEYTREMEVKEIFVIGGGEIFRQIFEQSRRIYMTRVHTHLEGDVFFPEINPDEWNLIRSVDHAADDKHTYAYTFQIWDRKK